jgi:hypothetical protein
VRADSRATGFTRRAVEVSRTLAVLGAEEQLSVTLGGTGTVQGTVFDSNGTTPFGGASMKITIQSPLFSNVEGDAARRRAGTLFFWECARR